MMPEIMQLWEVSDTLEGGGADVGDGVVIVEGLALCIVSVLGLLAGVCTPACSGFLLGRSAVWEGMGQEGV